MYPLPFRFLACCLLLIAAYSPLRAQYEALANFEGIRPRLLTDSTILAGLAEQIQPGGTHEAVWAVVRPIANRNANQTIPDQLFRGRGWELANLSAAYRYSGDQRYFDQLMRLADHVLDLPDWLADAASEADLTRGHILHGIALFYDWCYDELTPEYRGRLREVMISNMDKVMLQVDDGGVFWSDDYLGNHLWISMLGLSSASLAIYDEAPGLLERVTPFLDKAREKMAVAFESLGDDGANIEGMAYAGYGNETLLQYADLARKFFGKDHYQDDPFLENIGEHYSYMHLPRNTWTVNSINTEFCDNDGKSFGGPDFVARKIAAEFGNEQMQWLAEEVNKVGDIDIDLVWLNVLWYDPTVAAAPPTKLPTFKHFDNVDIVSARTDWNGDEALMVFKCGSFIGKAGMEARTSFLSDWGGAHAQPDANHVSLYYKQWLLEDDGFAWKYTTNHNTLNFDVNGRRFGQYNENGYFTDGSITPPNSANPTIVKAETTEEFDYTIGDATKGYKAGLLDRFERHVIFLKERNALIVVDDIKQAARNTFPAELRFFPTAQNGAVQDDGTIFFSGNKANLRSSASPSGTIRPTLEMVDKFDRNNAARPKQCLIFTNNANVWENAVVFSWADAGEEPPVVRRRTPEPGVHRFVFDDDVVFTLDVNERTFFRGTVSTETLEPGADFQLYPNPFTTELTVDTEHRGPTTLSLLDITGRLVVSRSFGPAETATLRPTYGQAPAGVYLLRVATEAGSRTLRVIRK